MPVTENINYQPPFLYRNRHINTIYTALLRPLFNLTYERERVETPDKDFLDLDWSKVGSKQLLVCVHGLEGNARKPYVRGMMHFFNQKHENAIHKVPNPHLGEGWDTLGINLRGCSGEDNRYVHSYHSGQSEDLDFVIQKIVSEKKYEQIAIVGFSIGGNIVMKYAGEQGGNIPKEVTHVVGLSVPCDLVACSLEFEKTKNWMYLKQFLLTLKPKARKKAALFPNQFDLKKTMQASTFREFDSAYTGPVNGFIDCYDYWTKASCLTFLPKIKIPALLISAKDDSFLAPECYPYELAHNSSTLHFEVSARGGHLGFMGRDAEGYLWTERRVWDFVNT